MECRTCEELQADLTRKSGDSLSISLGDTYIESVVLIDRRPSWSDSTPYPIQETEDGCSQVNAKTCMWVVDITPSDKFCLPFRTTRKITEFASCGEIHIPDEIDEEYEND